MKEIKFRGKTIKIGVWVVGYLVKHENRCFIFGGSWTTDKSEPEWNQYEVVPESVGQYIRLKDGEGNYIYENDLIECDRYVTHEKHIVFIENIKVIPHEMFGCNLNSRKIIGNSLDNPEIMDRFGIGDKFQR